MNDISIPSCVTDKLRKLNQLVEQYPDSIPVKAIANFLNCDGESVRAYLMTPQNAFGMGWIKDRKANRGFFVPTVKFYFWYRNLVERRFDIV